MNPNIANLFHSPNTKEIAGVKVIVLKLPFERFADAFTIGEAITTLAEGEFSAEKMRAQFAIEAPAFQAMSRVLAACLQLPVDTVGNDVPLQFKPQDVFSLPLVSVFEALGVVMEENADFFTQRLPSLGGSIARLGSTGSSLLNSLLERVTALKQSEAST